MGYNTVCVNTSYCPDPAAACDIAACPAAVAANLDRLRSASALNVSHSCCRYHWAKLTGLLLALDLLHDGLNLRKIKILHVAAVSNTRNGMR